MVLGANTQCRITGVDMFEKFITIFNQNSAKHKFGERVKGVRGDMEKLSFADQELDLIWSEGAIYNIGFEKGLREWSRFLKSGGYISVSEATWFTTERPAEINNYWIDAYPQIDTISNKVSIMERADRKSVV
jgi:ubiquinone/menaquinone biosynthesis C-methylase UbiE